MKQLSNAFIQALNDDEREYLAYATIQLMDDTVLNLTNEEIWSGGFEYEESISSDDSFTAIGSAIMGSAKLIINNIYEDYSDYDFTNARVSLSLKIQGADDTLNIGEYKVDTANYNGATIQLSLLDNMGEFDRPYSLTTLAYPTTLGRIVYDACLKCGVTAAYSAINFPNNNYTISTKPTDETVTFRDVISWAAALAGCFAKMNPLGQLEFKWFDYDSLDAIDTTSSSFHPWEDEELYSSSGVHYLYSLSSQNICTDDVVITGVTVHVKTEDDEATESDILAYSYTSSGYVAGDLENDGSEYIILVENNQFITKSNAVTVVSYLGNLLVGTRFRKLNITQISDPSIESGDVAIVTDRKYNNYKIFITRNVFAIGSAQTIVCGADTPSRSNSSANSETTKSYVEARKLFKKSVSAAEDALDSAIIAAEAAYEAQASADSALASATSANNSANNALTQLSIVEDVAGTLRWISEHGDFVHVPDTETSVQPGTIYYIYENGNYVPIVNPDPTKNPYEEGWYVLDVTDSQASYIMAHLAVTDAGLWVLPVNQLAPHQLYDYDSLNDEYHPLEDSDGNLLIDFSKDPQNATGYKVLLGESGMTIFNGEGAAVANYGTTTTIGKETENHVFINTQSVDIKNGSIVYARFTGDGMIIYENNTEIASFAVRPPYNFPVLTLDGRGSIIYANGIQSYADQNTGVYKAKYANTGIYYNDDPFAIGHIWQADEYTYNLSSHLWDYVTQFGLTPGKWLVIFGGEFASSDVGTRAMALSTSPNGISATTRYDITARPCSGFTTKVQSTRILTVTSDTQYYLYAYQNSNNSLDVKPYAFAIKII